MGTVCGQLWTIAEKLGVINRALWKVGIGVHTQPTTFLFFLLPKRLIRPLIHSAYKCSYIFSSFFHMIRDLSMQVHS